ncbi:MAG: HAD family hydrolase [Candidatus Eisenbacteria bacterium]|uniref:HAD family hydrolase n=1 Tax=Eiseniibacteriota bacterium TaxID=2212470 RepID=A0A9D6L514_UNCEI|nr:HAD family hydrolase [Candidatus Eisenbacteria bacterium]MBI3538916.1 HAD family hydrolase [Candidatus Eisenbacteria bacterium]
MSARPGLDAVIFDAGGTLIRLDFEWMADDLARRGVVTSPDALRRAEVAGRRAYDASGGPARHGAAQLMWIAAPAANGAGANGAIGEAPGYRGDIHAYFAGTLAAAGASDAAIEPAIARFFGRDRERGLWSRPMEGAREAIDALGAMGFRLAVVSNSDGRAERHLTHADMRRGVEFVVDSHVVGVEKPDPRIFAIALERLGVDPARALYVGDIRSVDETGALAAGMRFVLIDPLGDYAAPGAPRIDDMHALAQWVDATFERPHAHGGRAPR